MAFSAYINIYLYLKLQRRSTKFPAYFCTFKPWHSGSETHANTNMPADSTKHNCWKGSQADYDWRFSDQ